MGQFFPDGNYVFWVSVNWSCLPIPEVLFWSQINFPASCSPNTCCWQWPYLKKNIIFTPKNAYFDPFLATFWQKPKNWSTLGRQCTVKKNSRNILLDTIQEPLERGFQNTPYLSQCDNSSIFLVNILKIPQLWTATKCDKIIILAKVRGVLKTSWLWLLKCMKQNIPKVLSDYV